MKTLIRSLTLTVLLGMGVLTAEALSIVVAPTAVYLEHSTRSATVTLFNPGTTPEEVTISTLFGYPTTDEDGRLHLFTDEAGDDPRSAAGWLRAYPQRVVVGPGERQVVRLLGEPPADLPDGEYWARLAITSGAESTQVGTVPGESDVRVGLDMRVRTVIAANYRKGSITTGLEIEDFQPWIEDGRLRLRPRLLRQGSAAYISALTLTLTDPNGEVVREWQEQVAVYREYHRLFEYDVSDLGPGPFRLRAQFSTDRDDVPAAFRLRTTPIEREAPVSLR